MPLLGLIRVNLLPLFIFLLPATALNAQVLQWVRPIGGSGYDICDDVVTDAAGNVYVTGEFQNTVDFDPGASVLNLTSAGGYDIFICKYSAAGNLVWARRMGGLEDDGGSDIALDAGNNVYVSGLFRATADFDPGAGTYNLTSAGLADFFVCKLTNTGTFVWARRFGGTQMEYVGDLEIDNAGNVITTGNFNNTVDFDPGAGVANLVGNILNVFISKLNSAGNYVWAKQLTGSSSVFCGGLAEDAAGNLYLAGAFNQTIDFDPGAATANLTSLGNTDAYILKLNSSGTFQWVKRFGGASEVDANSIKIGSTGTIYTTGTFMATADFDPGAGTANLVSAGSRDIFIARLNASGNYISATRIGGTDEDIGYGITVDLMGNIYTSGRFKATVDFNPGTGTSNRTAAGGYDCFILKLGSALNYGWVCAFGGTVSDEVRAITLDPSNNVITAGLFMATPDFDPNGGVVNITAQQIDGFIHKLSNPSPLPIQLLNFDAIQNKNTVDITWQTATETNNDYFTIEKSKDGYEFESCGKVNGAGNSTAVLSYSFTDMNPHIGVSYYRLKQTDFNGQYSYSKTVAVRINKNDNEVLVYPNPATNNFVISFATVEQQNYSMQLLDQAGRVVISKTGELIKSTNFIDVNTSALPRGIYTLQWMTDNLIEQSKIVLK